MSVELTNIVFNGFEITASPILVILREGWLILRNTEMCCKEYIFIEICFRDLQQFCLVSNPGC